MFTANLMFSVIQTFNHPKGHVDSWRVMMALRSGQLSEAAWALNILTGLFADDQATSQVKLSCLPGLLDVLLKHLQSSLEALFQQDFSLPTGRCTETGRKEGEKEKGKEEEDGFDDVKEAVAKERGACESVRSLNDRKKWKRKKDNCLLQDDNTEEDFLWDKKCWDVNGRHSNTDHVVSHMEVADDEEVLRKRYFRCREAQVTKRVEKETDVDGKKGVDAEEERLGEWVRKEIESRLQEGGYIRDDLCGSDYSKSISCVEPERLQGEVFNMRDDRAVEVEGRCMQLVNIFRSLSFISSNQQHLCRHAGFLFMTGKLLMLAHEHKRDSHPKNEADDNEPLSLVATRTFWRTLESIREDVLVIIANIAGRLNLSDHREQVVLPLLHGLLHWCTCPSTYASDPDVTRNASLNLLDPGAIQPSFNNLALEAASKLSVVDCNVDLLLCTPPFSRIALFINHLCGLINLGAEGDHLFEEEMMMLTSCMSHLPSSNPVHQSFLTSSADWMSKQVSREFALVLVGSLLQANNSLTSILTMDRNFVGSLFKFIEVQCLRLNLCILTSASTSSDDQFSPEMLRKAALILLHVAQTTREVASHKERLLSLLYEKLPPSCDDEILSSCRATDSGGGQRGVSWILNEVLLHCLH